MYLAVNKLVTQNKLLGIETKKGNCDQKLPKEGTIKPVFIWGIEIPLYVLTSWLRTPLFTNNYLHKVDAVGEKQTNMKG